MTQKADFLVEIHTEELPPKALLKLAEAFQQQITERLQKAELNFAGSAFYASPRHLAVIVQDLTAAQQDQLIERRGPAKNVAFNAEGEPSPACIGFARSCGVTPQDLITIKTPQGEWMGYKQAVKGKTVFELLPDLIEQSLAALPIPKRMRWGNNEAQFVRPVHAIMMLFGETVIDATILGIKTGRETRGHRFHAPAWLAIPNAQAYVSFMAKAHVLVDFNARREKIRQGARNLVQERLGDLGQVHISSDALLNEVTGLVEFPVALCGEFDSAYLSLPVEVLISSMQDHQRYFPVFAAQKTELLPYFVTISNIESQDPKRVIAGNERVLRARLADAAFFYATDKKESLEKRLERLKGIVFQAKLGTLFDKVERVSQLTAYLAKQMGLDTALAARAGLLSKADLTTNMVGEFPELQGVMGGYYAEADGCDPQVATAIAEQYLPRFAGDQLPQAPMGQILALADRLDTLVGSFGINQIPTGDKDPYGLRRSALGMIRILIEKEISLDLKATLDFAFSLYAVKLANPETVSQVLTFIQERLRAWYQDQGITADVFASVAALSLTNLYDMHARIQAVQAFKQLDEAQALSVANKRVSNILSKYLDVIAIKKVEPNFFENAAENELALQLEQKAELVASLYAARKYAEVLMQLAELRQPIDNFFDQVMVMTEDKPRRENRLLLLSHLRALFLQVADIALLQQ